MKWEKFIKKYKVGDKVLIARKYESNEIIHPSGDILPYTWMDDMDSAIGKTGIITYMSNSFMTAGLKVEGIDSNWFYPTQCLEEIKKESKYERYEKLKICLKNLK
jgi:hypothetical protein